MSPIRNNVIEFQADLDAYAKKMGLEYETVVKVVVLTLFRKILLRTPVDTGRAAANWAIAHGEPPGEIQLVEGEGAISAALAKGMAVNFHPAEGVWWIYNNLPYIEVLEFGLYPNPTKAQMAVPWGGVGRTGPGFKTIGGFSIQAPAGMVRVSLAEIDVEIEGLLRQAGVGGR